MALAVLHADQECNSDEVRCRPKHTVFGREMVAPSTNEEDSNLIPALGSADPLCGRSDGGKNCGQTAGRPAAAACGTVGAREGSSS